jgi:hypothetical protein
MYYPAIITEYCLYKYVVTLSFLILCLQKYPSRLIKYCDVHAVGNIAFVCDSCYGNQATVECDVNSMADVT